MNIIKDEIFYNYYDEVGNLVYRLDPQTGIKDPKNKKSILYNLHKLIKSNNDLIIVVKNENDCDSLIQCGFNCVGSRSLSAFKKQYFINKNVVIINNDIEFLDGLKLFLLPITKSLRILHIAIGISNFIKNAINDELDIKEEFLNLFSTLKNESDITFCFDDGKFNHALLSDYILQKYNIIKYNNKLYKYYNGDYESLDNKELEILIRKEYRMIKRFEVSDTIADIIAYAEIKKLESNSKFIKLNNGIYDIENKILIENSKKFFIPNKIPHDYNYFAYCKTLDFAMDKWSNNCPEKRNLLEEIMGYCLYRSSKFKKFFLFQGDSNTGKSTFIQLLIDLVGDENKNGAKLQDLTKPFAGYHLYNKLLNIGDDISGKTLKDSDFLKSITSGHLVKVRQIHNDEIDLYNYATLIFACNQLPKMPDIAGGLDTRLIIVPFYKIENINLDLSEILKTKESLEYCLKLAINGLIRLTTNKQFTITDDVKNAVYESNVANNSIIEFIEQFDNIYEIFNNKPVLDTYQEYVRFIKINGGIPHSSRTYFSEMKRICKNKLTMKRICKDGYKIYIFKGDM